MELSIYISMKWYINNFISRYIYILIVLNYCCSNSWWGVDGIIIKPP